MSETTLCDRAVIRLSGETPRDFLQGLVTNDVAGPLPVWAGLLTPQGKALFDFLVWADDADVLIDCERDAAAMLVRRLSIYRLRRAITISVDESCFVHWSPDGVSGVPDPRGVALGRRWIAADRHGDASAAWRAHRLSLGLTEGRAELGDGTTLWLECNGERWNGVSYAKGCYVGQENTARMHYRSKVNRALTVVDAATDPGVAARVWYSDLGKAVVHERTSPRDETPEP